MRYPGRSVRDALTVLAFGCCAPQSVGLGCQTQEGPGPDMDFDDLKYSLDSGNTSR
jgi:hypothetical protein